MPTKADRRVFAAAPAVVVISTFLVFVVIPMGPDLVVKDLDVGVFYALAVSSLSVIGVLMAGWASANKFALLGALRAAAQLIAYELPLLLAVVGVVMQAGTMNLAGHRARAAGRRDLRLRLDRQPVHPHAVRRLRALPRRRAGRAHPDPVRHARRRERARRRATWSSTPGFRFLFFFIGEFGTAFAFAALAATLFLGGWSIPGVYGDWANILGPVVLFAKLMFVAFLMFWVRFTYPRLREDQLQALAWKLLIPIGLAQHPRHRRLQGGPLMEPKLPGLHRRPRRHVQDDAQARGHGAVPAREGRARAARSGRDRAQGRELHRLHALCALRAPTGASTSRATRRSARRAARVAGRGRSACSTASTSTTRSACTAASASRCARSTPCSGAPSTSTRSGTSPSCSTTRRELGEWMETVPEPEPLEVGAE